MNEQEFTQRLQDSGPMLYRVACVMLSSPEDRQDAMQETAVKAWQAKELIKL